jgi:hypothetical protein
VVGTGKKRNKMTAITEVATKKSRQSLSITRMDNDRV